MSAFVSAMDSRCLGENGALAITAAGVGEPLVALFFKLVRDLPDRDLDELMSAVEPSADLVVLAFQTRATRGMGKGEKKLFYELLARLARLDEHAVLATLKLVPHFGYWKDMLLLQEVSGMSEAVKAKALELMAEQLKEDDAELVAAEKEGRTPQLTLCAKFAPREGTHFDKKGGLGLASKLAKQLFGGANAPAAKRRYRQMLSSG